MLNTIMDSCVRKSDRASDIERASDIYSLLRWTRPKNRQDLKNYVKVFLGVDVPDKRICPQHNSPMDYLWHTFAADFHDSPKMKDDGRFTMDESRATNADCIVWANRTGGKTNWRPSLHFWTASLSRTARCEFWPAQANRQAKCTNT